MATTIIIAIVALGAGVLAGLLIANQGKNRIISERQSLEAQLTATQQSHASETALLNKQLETQRADAVQSLQTAKEEADRHLREYKGDVEQRYQEAIEKNHQYYKQLMDEQERRHKADTEALEKRFNDTVNIVKSQMESATNEMLKKRQEEFATNSNKNLEGIVNPLKETIAKMKQAMDENSTEQKLMKESVKDNLQRIIDQSIAAQRSAEELTRAFKHETKTQGNWGEVVLSNLLTSQGFTEGKDFETQATLKDNDGNIILSADGNRMIPDVLLHLDEGRDIIIDSKVSMTAFINYVNAEDETTRRQYLKEHVASLKKHVDELSAKDYTHYQSRSHIDFVIMFVPQAQALWTASNEDASLWQDAMRKRVFIADEHTLYAALRVIRITWTHIDQEKNHQKLYELAQEMIDRTGNFLTEYDNVGKSLRDALDSFDSSRKKLLPGGRSIGNTASQILALEGISNVRVSKSKKGTAVIPSDYIEKNLGADDEMLVTDSETGDSK